MTRWGQTLEDLIYEINHPECSPPLFDINDCCGHPTHPESRCCDSCSVPIPGRLWCLSCHAKRNTFPTADLRVPGPTSSPTLQATPTDGRTTSSDRYRTPVSPQAKQARRASSPRGMGPLPRRRRMARNGRVPAKRNVRPGLGLVVELSVQATGLSRHLD